MRVSHQQTVAAPVADVFSLFADIPSCADRIEAITKIEMLTDGPMREGTRWRETRRVGKRECTEEMGFSAFAPNRSYTVRGESMGSEFLTTFEFAERQGATDVRCEMVATPKTLAAKIASPMMLLMKGMMRKCLVGDMAALAKIAEGRSGAQAAAAES